MNGSVQPLLAPPRPAPPLSAVNGFAHAFTLHLNVYLDSDPVRLKPVAAAVPPAAARDRGRVNPNMIHVLITHVFGLLWKKYLNKSPYLQVRLRSFEYLKLIKYESLLSFIRT